MGLKCIGNWPLKKVEKVRLAVKLKERFNAFFADTKDKCSVCNCWKIIVNIKVEGQRYIQWRWKTVVLSQLTLKKQKDQILTGVRTGTAASRKVWREEPIYQINITKRNHYLIIVSRNSGNKERVGTTLAKLNHQNQKNTTPAIIK